MLVLARRVKERILVPSIDMTIAVVSINNGLVRLGIEAPLSLAILREEVESYQPVESLLAKLEANRKEKHLLRNVLHGTHVGISLLERQLANGATTEDIKETVNRIRWSICQHEPTNTEPATKPVRALLVEDQGNERLLLAKLLQMSGYDVVTADSGEQAIECANQVRPDVMLLDMGLPKMSGKEVVRLVRKDAATGQMKIFVISGMDCDEQLPVDYWFTKPLDPSRLLDKLGSLGKVG